MNGGKVTKRFRIDDAEKFRLRDIDPADTCGMSLEKREAKEMLAAGVKRLSELQERLYAQDRWAVLVIFQAMDAAGKDSAIAHVMSGVNPQGCQVFSFKAPTPQELDHDFLWRTTLCLPERGRIGIFNRSYYEEVLVVRAHPEILARQKLPPQLVTKDIWDQRFKDIRAFERHLARNGMLILKFFLHVSKEEQRRRFLERIDDPSKNWKFSPGDVVERKLWGTYMNAYEDMIRNTSRSYAPWYVVPADNKWFTRIVVAGAIIEALENLDLHFPNLDSAGLAELKRARADLLAEDKGRGNNKR
ncbi:MAG TPA: polyphosphate kinase 2 family protein [Pseudorhodoplanes sp.]|jgi:PPK2 family polyphosphate:nucleotide phosphotransferase|nr:polyphosphate kinase 2 family protein [Pseudorhodoplanes sp.]